MNCPDCNEGSIAEIDIIPALAFVSDVTPAGEIMWAGWSKNDWNGQAPKHDPPMFICIDCLSEFMLDGARLVPYVAPPADVIIEVRSGVASVTKCPDNVEVHIIDWDVEKEEAAQGLYDITNIIQEDTDETQD